MAVSLVALEHGLKNLPPKVLRKHTSPEAPPNLFRLHALMAFIGKCGSGKTMAMINLLRAYLDANVFTRVFVISPTFESNDDWQLIPEIDRHLEEDKDEEAEDKANLIYALCGEPQRKKLKPELDFEQESDVYRDSTQAQEAVDDILRKIEFDVQLWQASMEYALVYKKWKRVRKNITRMTMEEQQLLDEMDFEPPILLPKPVPVLLIDDMSHSDLFQSSPKNPFMNLCLRHRHVKGVGLTIMICVQNYRTGAPKCLRQNIGVFFIFGTKDTTQTDAVHEEVGNIVSREEFYKLYHAAIGDGEHHFLTVDLFPNTREPSLRRAIRFRKDFDQILLSDSLEDGEEKRVEETKEKP